jgi:hypothetical protein
MRAQTSSARRRKARPEARMPRALTLSVALAATGLIAAAPASAAEDRKAVKTQVKITRVSSHIVSPDFRPPYAWYFVKGKVRSPRAGCRYGRWVRLNHQTEDQTDGYFTASRDGVFWLGWPDRTFPFTQQHDRAKITRSPSASHPLAESVPDGRFTCKGDRSRRFTIPPPSEVGIAAAAPEQRKSLFRAGLRLGLRSG